LLLLDALDRLVDAGAEGGRRLGVVAGAYARYEVELAPDLAPRVGRGVDVEIHPAAEERRLLLAAQGSAPGAGDGAGSRRADGKPGREVERDRPRHPGRALMDVRQKGCGTEPLECDRLG